MLAAMPTTDETTPGLPTDEPVGALGEAATAPTADTVAGPEESAVLTHAGDGLSPAVRRLVRQYDLDITGIHGTGPDGRIRVGDVIGMLGGRTDATGARAGEPTRAAAMADEPDASRDAATSGDFRKSRPEDHPM